MSEGEGEEGEPEESWQREWSMGRSREEFSREKEG